MKVKKQMTLAITVTLILSVASACAAETSGSEEKKLSKITIRDTEDSYTTSSSSAITKTDTPILETPQSLQIVPRTVLDDQNAMTLTDAVRNVAGVSNDFGFNGSTQPLLILRGFSMTSMTAQSSMSGGASFYLNGTKAQGVPINMANVESVQVIKGPTSVLFGRSEPGGLVNIVTKQLHAEPSVELEQMFAEYGASRSVLDVGGALNENNTVLGRLSGSYTNNESNRDFVFDRLKAASGALGWVPDAATRVTLTLDYVDQKYRNDYGIPAFGNRPADLPWSRQFNDAPQPSSTKSTSALLDGEHAFTDNWKIKTRAVEIWSDTKEIDVAPYRVDLSTGEDCIVRANELCRYYFYARPDGKLRVEQFNVDLFGNFDMGIVHHVVTLGIDHYKTHKDGLTYLEQLPPANIFVPARGNSPLLDTSPLVSMENEMVDASKWTSVYVQDQIGFGGGVHIVAALRHDKTTAVYAPVGTEPNEDSFTTPRVGVVWQFVKTQSVYAQYQDSVAANNGRDVLTGNALPAEKAKQVEVGYKLSLLDSRLNSTFALYQLTKRNRSDFSQYPVVRAIGEARSRGFEWDLSGQLTRNLSVIASYAYTDAVVTEDPVNKDKRLANVPRSAGSLWARYALTPQWALAGGVFAQGQREGDVGNTFQLPGYARVDAMTAYDFAFGKAPTTLQLNIDNLLDKRYYTGSHQFSQDWIQVSKPRTVSVSLRLKY